MSFGLGQKIHVNVTNRGLNWHGFVFPAGTSYSWYNQLSSFHRVVTGEISAPKNTWRCLAREAYDTGKQLTWILKQPSHAVAFEAVFSSDRLMMILLTTTGQWNRKRERVGLHAAWLIIFRHSSVNCTSRHEASLSSTTTFAGKRQCRKGGEEDVRHCMFVM